MTHLKSKTTIAGIFLVVFCSCVTTSFPVGGGFLAIGEESSAIEGVETPPSDKITKIETNLTPTSIIIPGKASEKELLYFIDIYKDAQRKLINASSETGSLEWAHITNHYLVDTGIEMLVGNVLTVQPLVGGIYRVLLDTRNLRNDEVRITIEFMWAGMLDMKYYKPGEGDTGTYQAGLGITDAILKNKIESIMESIATALLDFMY